jgi:pilus assembly protein Flp/PilA
MFEYAKALLELYLPEKAEGQGMVEYGLIIVLVSVAAIVGLTLVGGQLQDLFNRIAGILGGGS